MRLEKKMRQKEPSTLRALSPDGSENPRLSVYGTPSYAGEPGSRAVCLSLDVFFQSFLVDNFLTSFWRDRVCIAFLVGQVEKMDFFFVYEFLFILYCGFPAALA